MDERFQRESFHYEPFYYEPFYYELKVVFYGESGMVASRVSASNEMQIILRANQSASWRVNLLVWGILSAAGLGISTGFALIGAPLVFPFVGLEIIILVVGFYLAARDSTRQQIIRIGEKDLVIEKGHRHLEQVLNLPRQWVRVAVTPDSRPLGTDQLFLCAMDQRMPVGEFLCQHEVEQLLSSLRQQGFPVRIEKM